MTESVESIDSFLERVCLVVNPGFSLEEKTSTIVEWQKNLGDYVTSVNNLRRLCLSDYWSDVLLPTDVKAVINELIVPCERKDIVEIYREFGEWLVAQSPDKIKALCLDVPPEDTIIIPLNKSVYTHC